MADGKNNRRNKDKEMAAFLKKHGIKRTTQNCPMCHTLIGLGSFSIHVPSCKPRRPQYGRPQSRPLYAA